MMWAIANGLSKRFSDLGLRKKLLIIFISLITIPVSIIAIRSYGVSSIIIESKTNQYSHDLLFQITKMVESRLAKIEDISFNVGMNPEVQELLSTVGMRKMDPYDANQARTRIEAVLSSQVLYNQEINSIFVVSFNGYVYELNKTKQAYGLLGENSDIIRAKKGSVVWFGGSSKNRNIVLMRMINSIRTQQPIGYLVIYVDERYLFDLLSGIHSIENGSIFLVDRDGEIVSAADKKLLGNRPSLDRLDAKTEAYTFSRQKVDGITQYVASSEPMNNGWKVVTTVPVMIYQSEIDSLRNSTSLFTLALLIVSVFGAWGLSLNISKPISRLSSVMVRFGEGDFSSRGSVGGKDETGRLSETFNQMADNINILVQKVYDEQRMKRDAELKSLQMQINPHFLYNTLESVNWMARAGRTEDVCVMVTSLGDLMRSSINSRDYVCLEEEIASLRHYLQIQKYRYGDKLETSIRIAADTEKMYVPKLIIQPLIENAIYHGIEPILDGGIIEVNSSIKNDDLRINIIDNGVGMTKEVIEHALNSDRKDNASSNESIGINNVVKRIKTLFGNRYGMEIQSELGYGTQISILLPAISEINTIMEYYRKH
jgi:two-component system sensor histidine kinase YesM